jgi:allantoinase
MARYDRLITNVRVVRPGRDAVEELDVAIDGGSIAAVAADLDPADAAQVFDGGGKLAFPGLVDAHQHWGIYNPLEADSRTESRASAQGGVTTGITYIRTGQYYLNRGGPYAEFFPEVLERSEGRSYVDFAFHLAPMMRQHIDEIPELIEEHGVSSFKIFMFYGQHGLHGRSDDQASFLMIPDDERYDLAHFEFVMRGVQRARERFPERADQISLSLHCETAEIMRAYTEIVQSESDLQGLEAYSASRPPHSEGLAVTIASYLAHETGLANINLLHLSSATAIDAALRMAEAFPQVDFRREVTIGHLTRDVTCGHIGAKVNPPIRPREDVEALWDAVLADHVDWIVSDHACCRDEMKFGEDRKDVFLAKSGFGGTEYLLSALHTEGTKRGLSPNRMAELLSWNPAQRFGLNRKGTIAPGYDADVVLFDPDAAFTVRAEESESSQEYTPFEGMDLVGQVRDVFLRGQQIVADGVVVGDPAGRYVARPTARTETTETA